MSNMSIDVDALIDYGLGIAGEVQRVNWSPVPGSPQERAYHCTADEIGYGGAAGGMKTDTLLGKAFTQFQRAFIFRRYFTDMVDLVERGDEITDGVSSFVWGLKRAWELPNGNIVRIGAIDQPKDLKKHKGRAKDFIGIDEADEFKELDVRTLTGWLRTDDPNQNTQVMMCFNPPTTPEGEWVIRYFAPWLDEDYPTPAKNGELRWVYTDSENKDIWVDGPEPIEDNGKTYYPKSRTFFKALVDDNPFYMATGYDKQLSSLPEPLRSQLRYGDFTVSVQDDEWQVIPTQWIIEAQNRTLKGIRPQVNIRATGVDPSRGGDDETSIANLYGTWFEIASYPGTAVPDGSTAARYVTDAIGDDNPPVFVDVIGIGASVYDHLKVMPGLSVTPVNVGTGSSARDKTGRYQFFNLRSEIYWKLREALDPDSGENIALPPGRDIRADLRAARYSIVSGKIKVEPKDKMKERLGRSPDKGEAVMLAWHGATHGGQISFMEF